MLMPIRTFRSLGCTAFFVLCGCDDAPLFPNPPHPRPPEPPPYDAGNPPPIATPDAGDCAPALDSSNWPADADACWRRALWATTCLVEIADHPEVAVPPLVWGACPEGSAAGCEALVVNWSAPNKPVAPLQVLATGNGYRVGAYEGWPDGEKRIALFDELGQPFVAYRTKCTPVRSLLTANRWWFGVQEFGPSIYTINSYTDWANPTVIPVEHMSQGQSADDDLLALWVIDGRTNLIYDRLSGKSYKLSAPVPDTGGGYAEPFVVNGNAIVRYYPFFEKPEAWIWTRAKKIAEPLIQPTPEIISDFRSDGKTLIWVQNPPKPVEGQGDYPPGNLWTSPFATTKEDLKPTMLRPVPIVGESGAGGGHYAFYSADKHIHVYRLADARHWDFALSPGMGPMFGMSFIDEKYVWFNTRLGEYRQPISTLGPGDSAP